MALTMDQLNAVYNDMSVYGDTYKNSVAPMAVNTNVASIPDVAPINNIQPYLPIINQGGNDGGITTINNRIDSNDPTFRDPFNNILENYIQENEVNPDEFLEKYSDDMFNVQETKSKGIGIQSLIDAYQKFSPLGMVYRAGKSGIETAQKYFADKKETERLFEIREAKKARELKIAQEQIRVAEEQKAMQQVIEQQAMDEQKYKQQATQYQRSDQRDQAQNRQQEREQAGPGYSGSGTAAEMGSFARGGRIRYGKGGIVTL
jgi:hypothetical protein